MIRQDKDWKLLTILVLGVLLVGVGSWIGYSFFQARERGLVIQGVQQGQLQGQMNVINAVQTTGYFAFNVADQEGQAQQMVLVGQLATPEQLQQAQQAGPVQ
jgi:hypothetical protein|tara:strand:- start:885 stop:1190 length:306 start_codon:yes stop_codon:yes gene_type:complete